MEVYAFATWALEPMTKTVADGAVGRPMRGKLAYRSRRGCADPAQGFARRNWINPTRNAALALPGVAA
jgi:hypothetical protein